MFDHVAAIRRCAAGLAALAMAAGGARLAHAESGAAGTDDPAADNGAVVLMYHRFGNQKYPSTNVRMEQFKAHIEKLSEDKYTVMRLSQLVAALENDEPLPEHAVAITVDDAYKSFYERAWPLLKDAGMPVTLFAATKPIEQGYASIMSWDQVEAVDAHELGRVANHTHTHAHMPQQSLETNREDIARTQTLLEEHLGRTPTLFSYPYGEYTPEIAELVAEAGFTAAFGQHSGPIARTNPMHTLRRYAVNEAYGGMDRFNLIVNSLPLPVRELTPDQLVLDDKHNPPAYGFTAHETVQNLDSLTCYASDRGKVDREILGNRVEVRLESPLPEGRSRINCTMPTRGGRWRWLGQQFAVPRE